ncbi:MAG TPA: tRNA threonylcarbamoyladenosine dehydratase [Clostridia bacterium]|nr:tRNA threonylcarbamoyladenosine dehydratase [Clostridia bacterium]
MQEQFSRTELLIGKQGLAHLKNARVAVFGLGGVGGHAVEALARSGIGALDLIDNDKICASNINRQIFATHKTIGQYKTDVAMQRVLDINPNCVVNLYNVFYLPETSNLFDFSVYDYVIDAIDTVTGKIELIVKAKKCNTPIISAMGAGNKMNPTQFEVSDISKTSICPLARVMRKELKNRGIHNLKVVYSTEIPLKPKEEDDNSPNERKKVPGSIAFAPSVAGLIMASEVIKDIINYPNK